MNSGSVFALGLMAGVMIVAWYMTRKNRKAADYDEMQLKIRAAGYRIGFFTALFIQMILILLSELGLLTVTTPGFAAFASLLISVVVFAAYCILHDAFLAIRGKAGSYLWIFSLVVLTEVLVTVRNLTEGKMLENGRLTFQGGAPAATAAGFTVLLTVLIVKTIRNRKEAEE